MKRKWEGKKLILGQPITFTSYRLEDGLLIKRQGIFQIRENQIQLYRVVDVEFKQDLIDNLVNQGTIILHCSNKMGSMTLENVGNPMEVKALINKEIAEQRRIQGIKTNETVAGSFDIDVDMNYAGDNDYPQDNFR